MHELFSFSLACLTGFFAVMNPIANTPIFIGLVEGASLEERIKIARTACVTALLIVVAFVVSGQFLFELFDITIPAFKITGGILLFYVGFEMLQSKKSSVQRNKVEEVDEGLAVSPLAIPILAGPGTIVTAMNKVTSANVVHTLIVIACFTVMIILTYWAFRYSKSIVDKLGVNLITVVGKIMGLILSIMGTGMVIQGIGLAFP